MRYRFEINWKMFSFWLFVKLMLVGVAYTTWFFFLSDTFISSLGSHSAYFPMPLSSEHFNSAEISRRKDAIVEIPHLAPVKSFLHSCWHLSGPASDGVRQLSDFIQMCTSALSPLFGAIPIRIIVIIFNSRLFARYIHHGPSTHDSQQPLSHTCASYAVIVLC